MAGTFVPLKGSFAIVQVNADSCVAQPIGRDEHGEAAVGMLAVIPTGYPNQPQRVTDYRTPPNAAILQGAQSGMTDSQHFLAMSAAARGDYDGALAWWERAQAAGTTRFIVASAARGRARILALRGRFDEALAVLQDAAARTAPSPEELTFAAYSSSDYDLVDRAVELHVDVLEEGGTINRVWLRDIDEANKWYSAAARIMEAVATRDIPFPDDPLHASYLRLLVDLGSLYLDALQDEENAVKWLQVAADAGSERAIQMLRALGR
jgi:TPR repeat protein